MNFDPTETKTWCLKESKKISKDACRSCPEFMVDWLELWESCRLKKAKFEALWRLSKQVKPAGEENQKGG